MFVLQFHHSLNFYHIVIMYMYNYTLTHTYLCTIHTVQFSEIEVEYPGWALFIGAVIILMALLPIPIVLIGRLILYQSARDEAVNFFKSLRSDAEHLYGVITSCRLVAFTINYPLSFHSLFQFLFVSTGLVVWLCI